MQHNLLGHMMPLYMEAGSCDANSIVNGTIALKSHWSKWMQHDFLVMWHHWHQHQHHIMLMALSRAPLHSLHLDDQSEVQHDFSGHVMPLVLVLASNDAVSIPNITITFLRSRQLKLEVTCLFLVSWHNCHWHWCHMMHFLGQAN